MKIDLLGTQLSVETVKEKYGRNQKYFGLKVQYIPLPSSATPKNNEHEILLPINSYLFLQLLK